MPIICRGYAIVLIITAQPGRHVVPNISDGLPHALPLQRLEGELVPLPDAVRRHDPPHRADGRSEALTFVVGIIAGFRRGVPVARRIAGADGAEEVVEFPLEPLAKLGMDLGKRMRFLLQMMQLFYSLMMGKAAIVDGLPFQQHLGPVRA